MLTSLFGGLDDGQKGGGVGEGWRDGGVEQQMHSLFHL